MGTKMKDSRDSLTISLLDLDEMSGYRLANSTAGANAGLGASTIGIGDLDDSATNNRREVMNGGEQKHDIEGKEGEARYIYGPVLYHYQEQDLLWVADVMLSDIEAGLWNRYPGISSAFDLSQKIWSIREAARTSVANRERRERDNDQQSASTNKKR